MRVRKQMSKEIYTDALYRIDMPKLDDRRFLKHNEEYKTIEEFAHEIVVDFEKQVNEFTIQQLYNRALLKGWISIIVIDETQFEKFIKECLPKWQEKERENESKTI